MKIKHKKSAKTLLSDKIADSLTVKSRADIEDDQVFGTKPQTLTKGDFGSSESEDEPVISDFRKRNVNLLSDISKKYEGQVVSRKDVAGSKSEGYKESDSEDEPNNILVPNLSALVDDSIDSDVSEYQENKKTEKQKKYMDHKEDFSSEAESEDYSIMQNVKKQIQNSSDEEEEEQSDEGESEVEEEGGEGYDISAMNEPMKEDFEHVKKQNLSEEAKKGACVRNQLLIWEGLLEMRIHLQRCINTANQMPVPETHEELKKDNVFTEECNIAKTNVATVLDKFLTLQNALLKNYPETKDLSTKKDGSAATQEKNGNDEEIPSDTDNEEIPSDTEEEDNAPTRNKEIPKKKDQTSNTQTKKRKLEDYEKELSTSHKVFKPFRDSVINKWDDKTRIATASAMKNKDTPTNTVIQRIQYILSDKDKLVKRTQLKRSEFDIIGYKKPVVEEEQDQNGTEIGNTKDRKDDDEYITEIFDDSDFYHQLLRELIEFKSSDVFDPVQLTRQWITLQQMRSKMKRKVDTKATKGRKIKYVVHNKLVNYMAPEKCTTWTDESTNELYSSLFGKMFENNNIGLNVDLENGFKIKN